MLSMSSRLALRSAQSAALRRAQIMPIRRAATTDAQSNIGASSKAEDAPDKKGVLQKGAKKDPELYILLAIMSGAFLLVGLHFGRKPTSASSEQSVSMAKNSAPWQTEGNSSEHFKYQYHPGGDTSKAPKDAPSALNTVIVPAVNLPKHLHDKYNKWGKEGY